MNKILQVVIYKSVSSEKKLAKYAELAGPAMIKAGAKFLARGLPVAVREAGKKQELLLLNGRTSKPPIMHIIAKAIKKR